MKEMTFKELSLLRVSVRDYNSEKPIEDEKLNYVLECARQAPSAVNFQPWKVYVIEKDSPLRAEIQSCYHREWFLSAPMYLVCTILHDESWKRRRDGKDHGDIDIAIFTEHICLAAAEQDLGTCWVCNFDAEKCKEVLHLPDTEEPAVLIPIGYPSEEFTTQERKRKTLDEIVKFI